ncbi:MAG: MarR family winged helix-turn-helix transcriptional regulator [Myxococcota bacterium]
MNDSSSPLLQILHAAQRLEARLEAELDEAGLSMAKLGVLRCLTAAKEPLALGGVAESVRCVRSNVTQLVDRLEADGLVRRVGHPAGRRVKRAELTAAGRRAHADGAKIMARHEATVTEALGSEAAALARALERLG